MQWCLLFSVMNRQDQQPAQGQGFSGRTRIILPGQEGDPNRVLIPGQQSYNNNPYNNNNNNPYNNNNNNPYNQQNRGNIYTNDNSMYQNQNIPNQNRDNNNPFNNNNNNPFNVNDNKMRSRQGASGQNRRNMLQSSRSLQQSGPGLLPMGDPRCMFQFGQINTTASPGSCSLCSASR